ncbi:hypothetical protein EVAR_45600_1 [Eumeta japonica]|uniref:Uncharacterized protein n=1 Tax=Eumeta variegata TaxID=151549 RepID=A0A4C1YXX1_EUMVA|nr:hypothetical protein EVAR_45600_1 [Eumeta japonica]
MVRILKNGASESRSPADANMWSRNMSKPKRSTNGLKRMPRRRAGNDFTLPRTRRYISNGDYRVIREALDILTEVDPSFMGTEVKMVLKEFNLKKAPGIDRFISDISQASILWDLRLFLVMKHKF